MRPIEIWVIGQGGACHYGGTYFSWRSVFAWMPMELCDGSRVRWEIFTIQHPTAVQLKIVIIAT